MVFASMLDVKAVSGFPGKLFHIGEAALNGLTPDQELLTATLDRLDAALARIAQAGRDLAQRQLARRDSTGDADLESLPPVANGNEPEWARDVAGRLDGLIGELRRALSGEQT